MLKWGIPLLTAVVIVGGGLAYFQEQRQNNEVACQAANDTRAVLRNLLVSARAQTPKRRLNARAQNFYDSQLAKLKPLDCGHFDRDSLARAQGGDASPGQTQQPP